MDTILNDLVSDIDAIKNKLTNQEYIDIMNKLKEIHNFKNDALTTLLNKLECVVVEPNPSKQYINGYLD